MSTDTDRVSEILQKGNRQLAAENQRLKAIIAQRGADALTSWMDGFDQILSQAQRGDATAKLVLSKLGDQLESLAALKMGIVLPRQD